MEEAKGQPMRNRSLCAPAAITALFLLTTIATSCSEDGAAPGQTAAAPRWSEKKWLDVADEIEPEVWLVSREVDANVELGHPRLTVVRANLAVASHRFGESPRMIANRAVQLETILSETDEPEAAVRLIGRLTSVVGETGQTEGFGAVGQYYVNMRRSGVSSHAALDQLKSLYGARK